MRVNLKKLDIGNKVTKISLEHESTERSSNITNEIKAIAILLGGYNEFGQSIDEEIYNDIRHKFDECIYDIKQLLTNKQP